MTITVRAPGRVNLIGDHTDYTGGLVFPMAIDRWTEVVGESSDRIQLSSRDEPGIVDLPVGDDAAGEDIPGWGRFVAAVAAEVQPMTGFRGTVSTTIPVGAGLSSSAALEVALAIAFGFRGSAIELAKLTQRAEHRAVGVPCGIMDQLCIAAAQRGHATLIDCGELTVDQVPIPDDVTVLIRFIAHRTLVDGAYAERVQQCNEAESIIGPLRAARLDDLEQITDATIRRRARHVITENARVRSFADALSAGEYDAAGALMTDSHHSLRDDFATSTPEMDAAVDELLANDTVYGARMTGGGFGGCVVALCAPEPDLDGWVVRPVDGASAEAATSG